MRTGGRHSERSEESTHWAVILSAAKDLCIWQKRMRSGGRDPERSEESTHWASHPERSEGSLHLAGNACALVAVILSAAKNPRTGRVILSVAKDLCI